MTDQQHPITPPPELVEQWIHECTGRYYEQHIATQAARWGADQQLEQDAKWLDTNAIYTSNLTISPSGDALRQAMRPKPPSLKERALKALDDISIASYEQNAANTIRQALEALND